MYPKGRNCSHLQLVSASRACLTRGFSGGGRQDKSLNCRPTTPHHHSVLRSGSIENEHPIRYMIRYSKSDSVCDSRERDPRMTAPTSASQHQHLSPPFSPRVYPNSTLSTRTSDDTNYIQLQRFPTPRTTHLSAGRSARAATHTRTTDHCAASVDCMCGALHPPFVTARRLSAVSDRLLNALNRLKIQRRGIQPQQKAHTHRRENASRIDHKSKSTTGHSRSMQTRS